jgi:hypothetical protein
VGDLFIKVLLGKLLFECRSLATSKGSPFNLSFTTNSFYIKIIFLIFRFKGQREGLGMITYQFP